MIKDIGGFNEETGRYRPLEGMSVWDAARYGIQVACQMESMIEMEFGGITIKLRPDYNAYTVAFVLCRALKIEPRDAPLGEMP